MPVHQPPHDHDGGVCPRRVCVLRCTHAPNACRLQALMFGDGVLPHCGIGRGVVQADRARLPEGEERAVLGPWRGQHGGTVQGVCSKRIAELACLRVYSRSWGMSPTANRTVEACLGVSCHAVPQHAVAGRGLAWRMVSCSRLGVGGAGVLLAGRPPRGRLDPRVHQRVPLVPSQQKRSGHRGQQRSWYNEAACSEHLTAAGSTDVVLATVLLNGAAGRVV